MKKSKFLYYLGVLGLIIFSLGPIVWCFIISITPEGEMLKASGNFLPSELTFDNYANIFDTSNKAHISLFNGLTNSLLIAAITLAIGIPVSITAAYALVRSKFRGQKVILTFILMTIVIPVFTTIIPVYSIFRNNDMLDSLFWTAIIYVSAFIPLNMWIIMNYFKELPKELWQAAMLDGFTESQMFFKVVLPLSKPVILTSTLTMFIMSWKQYTIPMILISSYDNKMLTMVMSEFMTRDAINYGIIAVCGLVAVIPPALGAVLFRKFLVSGLTSGSVKG